MSRNDITMDGATWRLFSCSFFFQAEDGIRDKLVTGVQTCALPISVQRVTPLRVPKMLTTSVRPESVPESESNSQITTPAEEPAGAMTFFEHLSELRKRIIYSLYAIGVGAFICVYVSKYIINWIIWPIIHALTQAHLDTT